MARKKLSALAAARTQEDDLKPQRDLSPDHKLDNLKTLNQLLLKETMEKRFQIDQLKAQIEELGSGESGPLTSDIEREVCCIVLSSAVGEEAEKAASLRERLGLVSREKDEVKKELGNVVSERDLMRKEVDLRRREVEKLESKIGGLERENGEIGEKLGQAVVERDEIERLARKREEVFESLKENVEKEREETRGKHREEVKLMRAEIESNAAKISELEDERRGFLDVKHRLEGETHRLKDEARVLKDDSRGLKDEAGFLRCEEARLRLKVAELEKSLGEFQEEMGGLQASIVVLVKEKEEKKREVESKAGELALELDELRKKIGEVSIEKDEIERVKAEKEVEILELKTEVEKLCLSVAKLEEMCGDYGEKNARLLDEKDAVRKEFAELETEMGEKEKGFEIEIEKLTATLDDLSAKLRGISVEKDEVGDVRAKQDAEIAELKKEVERLSSDNSELEEKCRDYGERSTQLQDERDAVKRELGVQRGESSRLGLQVEELKKSKDECLRELKQLNASLDAFVSEKEEGKRQIESLTEEKTSLEKSLFASKEESESLLKKMRAAELISGKALSLLKSTAEALNEAEKAQEENGVIDDDGIRPFSEELESIRGAFKSRAAKMEEMNRELEVLQTAVENAKKKKKMTWGLHMLLYPATAVLAAIFAYAARGR